jgi:cysteine synthase A
VALAEMCRLRGHTFVGVVDPKVSPANLAAMKRAGAQVEWATRADETGNYLQERIARVRAMCAAEPGVYWSNQYGRSANPRVHYLQTGPELLRQAGRDLDCVFVAVSTGGTLSGVGAYLRAASPLTTVIGVDALGSMALGGSRGTRWLSGIGATCRSNFVGAQHLDERSWVTDAEAIAVCRKLAAEAGLSLGGSSGAVVAACLRYLEEHPFIRRPVCLCPDDGDRYRTSLYDDDWVRDHDIDLASALARMDADDLRFGPPPRRSAPGPAGRRPGVEPGMVG